MITQKTIQTYAANQPTIVSQTFHKLIGNNDEVAHSAIEGYLKPFIEYLGESNLTIQDFEDIQSLVDVHRGRSLQLRTKNKVLRFCFKWVVDSLYGKFVGISFAGLNKNDQRLASEGVFLASLYRKVGGNND